MHPPLPPFEKDLARARTLPAWCYTDPDLFRLERARIFARTWQPVGRVAQVAEPGEFFTCDVAGEPLVVVRDRQGELRALHNVCRHRAGAVAEGCGRRKSLQCAYHGWTYDLDGRLLATPEFDGVEDFDRAAYALVSARVTAWGPFVFVNLDANPPPLADVLDAIPHETQPLEIDGLELCASRDYLVQCNWKVYIDNYLEGYHVPIAHPGLFRELDYPNYRVETFRYYSTQHAPIRPSSPSAGERRYRDTDGTARALYYWVFPNWMLNVYPDNLSLNIVLPVAVDQTLMRFEWYARDADGPTTRAVIERTVSFSDEIQREDVKLCEQVQARLGSRSYESGRFSVLRENGVHHFQGLVHEFLTTAEEPDHSST